DQRLSVGILAFVLFCFWIFPGPAREFFLTIKQLDLWSAQFAYLRLAKSAQDLESPEGWEEEIAILLSSRAEHWHSVGALYSYYRSHLMGDLKGARISLEQAIEGTSQSHWLFNVVRLNAAIFLGFYDRNADRAQDALSALNEADFAGSYTYPMAVAATRMAQARENEALDAANEAKRIIQAKSGPDPTYPQEEAIVDAIIQECEAALAAEGTE
ncbi:MAG TPA: hypothetical protein VEX38_03480, partial [Fimbriimonadaceae bacterium]|nr:hypothetical protein [Fimbriimonadaceae bacterium]